MKTVSEEELVSSWEMVYNISLNMLHNPADAEDAVQEIFEKAARRIQSFQGRSAFSTWVYSIARNHLLDIRQKGFRDEISFDLFERDVTGFDPYMNELGLSPAEEKIYIDQIKNGCTLAMLQCLKPESRLIYILSNIFAFSGKDAAEICCMEEAKYRKKLSRARAAVSGFMQKNCGLQNPVAFCSCRNRILIAREQGRVQKDFPSHTPRLIRDCTAELNELDASAEIFRQNWFIEHPVDFALKIKSRFKVFAENFLCSSE